MSTRSLRAKLIMDLAGNLRSQATAFGRSFRRLGDQADHEMGRIGRAAAQMDRGLNRTLIRGGQGLLAGATIGAGLIVRRLGSVEERYARLGEAADQSAERMEALRNSINDTAKASDVRIDPSELLGAVEKFVQATGNFDLASDIQREMALAIQATGSAGEEIGALVASMAQQFDIDTPEGILNFLDTLTIQGKAGAIELADLARLGPKVFAAYRRIGKGGEEGAAEAGAMMQVFKRGVGSADEAATVFENVIGNFMNSEKRAKLEEIGDIALTDENGEAFSPGELIKNVIRSAGGDDLKLAKVFDAEAMRGLGALSKMYRDTGGFAEFDEIAAIRGDGEGITASSGRLAGLANSAGQNLMTNINDRLEDNLLGPLKALTESLNALVDEGVKFTLEDAANIGIGGAVALGGVKAGLAGMRMLSGRGKGGKGGKGGGDVPGADLPGGDVQKVFVTNWQGQQGGGAAPGGTGGTGGGSKRVPGAGRAARAAGVGGLLAMVTDIPTMDELRAQHADKAREPERPSAAARWVRSWFGGDEAAGAAVADPVQRQRPASMATMISGSDPERANNIEAARWVRSWFGGDEAAGAAVADPAQRQRPASMATMISGSDPERANNIEAARWVRSWFGGDEAAGAAVADPAQRQRPASMATMISGSDPERANNIEAARWVRSWFGGDEAAGAAVADPAQRQRPASMATMISGSDPERAGNIEAARALAEMVRATAENGDEIQAQTLRLERAIMDLGRIMATKIAAPGMVLPSAGPMMAGPQ